MHQLIASTSLSFRLRTLTVLIPYFFSFRVCVISIIESCSFFSISFIASQVVLQDEKPYFRIFYHLHSVSQRTTIAREPKAKVFIVSYKNDFPGRIGTTRLVKQLPVVILAARVKTRPVRDMFGLIFASAEMQFPNACKRFIDCLGFQVSPRQRHSSSRARYLPNRGQTIPLKLSYLLGQHWLHLSVFCGRLILCTVQIMQACDREE